MTTKAMQSEYLTLVNIGHPVEFALDRVSSRWGVSVEQLRVIVDQCSPEAIRESAQSVRDVRAHLRKLAELARRSESRQHKPDPRLSKLNN